jgi:hypothetical protein
LAQIEKSVARYRSKLDTADRQAAAAVKDSGVKDKPISLAA